MVKNQQYEYLEGKEEKFQIEVSMKKPYGQLPQAQYLHRSRGGDALTQNLIDRNTSVACAVRTFTLFSLITLSHDWNPAQASAFNMQRFTQGSLQFQLCSFTGQCTHLRNR